MIVGTIKIKDRLISTENYEIGYQYSENLQIQVTLDDTLLNGYTLLWYFSNDWDMRKTGGLGYDATKKLITLTPDSYRKAGKVLISLRAIKGDEVITSNALTFYIDISANPEMQSIKANPDWEKTAMSLIEQVFQRDYKNIMDKLISDTSESLKTLEKNMNTSINSLVKTTGEHLDQLRIETQLSITEIKEEVEADISASESLRDDLIIKRDSGFFNGKDGKNGINGKDGATVPHVVVGTVTPGSSPSVTTNFDGSTLSLDFVLPDGNGYYDDEEVS